MTAQQIWTKVRKPEQEGVRGGALEEIDDATTWLVGEVGKDQIDGPGAPGRWLTIDGQVPAMTVYGQGSRIGGSLITMVERAQKGGAGSSPERSPPRR